MLTELDERETRRIWQVAKKVSGNGADDLKVFRAASQIVARLTEWDGRQDSACAPGPGKEGIDEVLQANGNPDELLDVLFEFINERVEEAFRYGYCAAIEDGNLKL